MLLSMTNIVIPVKNPSTAKQRLGDLLTQDQRHDLALALFSHVLATVRSIHTPLGCLVVTDSDEVAHLAAESGSEVLREPRAVSETIAVDTATRWSCSRGFDRQMVIPADLPWVTAGDLEEFLDLPEVGPSVVLCPATGDDGTNVVLTSPPDALTFRFGARSFPDYVDQTRRRLLPLRIIRNSRLALDLDTPDDLKTFLDLAVDCPVYQMLRGWNVRRHVPVA